MAIISPDKMDFSNKNLIMIISGAPGVGKTTLALSAPDVLLIDADEGMARVNPAHRKDSSICKTYEELLADIKAAEGRYKTVVIDTGGALIEMMKDWAMRTEPSATRKNGGFSLQGYGVIKSEFLRMSADLRRKFNVIFLFHTTREKNGDEDFFEIVVEGSTRSLVYQPADLAAYCHIINGERYLGFTPTMNYNAKSAYGIKGLVRVPELKEGDPNDFLTKLFAQVKANLAAEGEALKPQQEAYEKAMAEGRAIIDAMSAPEKALEALNAVRGMPHSLTSQKELESAFKARVRSWALHTTRRLRLMSQRESKRFLITQSLLSGWMWSYKLEDGYEDFLKTLRREPIQQTKAMLDGIRFENVLNAVLNGAEIEPTHEWYKPIMELYPTLHGAQQQVRLSRNITVHGVPLVLYGVLDFLRAGVVYDTKYSKTYRVGKYLDSPQHPAYFALVPEAREFQYKICDGRYIYTETYHPDEVEPIERIIKQFMDFLDKMNLVSVFCEHWRSKY